MNEIVSIVEGKKENAPPLGIQLPPLQNEIVLEKIKSVQER
jgi:hypothetical protein